MSFSDKVTTMVNIIKNTRNTLISKGETLEYDNDLEQKVNELTTLLKKDIERPENFTELVIPKMITEIGQYAFYGCTSLTELTLPDSLTSIGNSAFRYCTSLANLTLAQGFNCNGLNVSSSTRFTAETIAACLEALADRTGQTAYTITFGSTNLNKLTAEQKAIATNKNWNLA